MGLFLFSTLTLSAQDNNRKVLHGWVRDAGGEPLPGATVSIQGSKQGAVTDADGNYVLTLPAGDNVTLVYSFIGMEQKTVKYKGERTLNITLDNANAQLDEVVVTGYQNIQRRDLVGAYTTLKADEVLMPSYTSIDQMLQGRVAGMVVTSTSSRVGTSPSIQIRGTSTLLGNQDPLWVIDGIIQEDPLELSGSSLMTDDLKNIIGNQISWLNPADIESITILKDASATAIYGSKASNGVIEIQTKKSKSDRLSINYNANMVVGTQPNYGQFNWMNSKERVAFSQEAFNWGTPYYSAPFKQIHTYEGLLRMYLEHDITVDEFLAERSAMEVRNTDWFKLLTRTPISHNHNVSMSGGTNKYSYTASMGYNNNQGQEIGNDGDRMTGRIAVTMRPSSRFTINASLNGSTSTTNSFATGVNPLSYATNTNRTIASDAWYQRRASYSYNDAESLSYNFLNERDNSGSRSRSNQLQAALDLKWNILEWLTYQFTGGYTTLNSSNEAWENERTYYVANNYRGYDYNSVTPGSDLYAAALLPFGGELYTSDSHQNSYNIQNKLQISKTFNPENRLNALLGFELRSAENKSLANTVYGYVPERGEVIIPPTTPEAFVPITNSTSGWGILRQMYEGGWKKTNQTNNFMSFFATFAYSHKNRYVLNANMRNDASNRFGQNTNRLFDPTYVLGFSWRASEESFLKENVKWISSLNLRATYGIQGNALTNVSPDLILNQGKVAELYNQYVSTISQIPNPYLSWERTTSWNWGLDLGLFNLLNMNIEYYTRRSNAVIRQTLPYEYGIEYMNRNGGIIYNRGLEYTLNVTPIHSEKMALSINLNASKNWNEGGQTTVNYTRTQFINGASDVILKEGYPLGSFWSYSFAGLNAETGEAMFNLLDIPADQRSRTLDPASYLVYSGQRTPYFTGGLGLSFRYRSVTLNTTFSLLMGNKKRLPSPYEQFTSSYYMPDPTVNVNRDLLNRWKEPGDEARTIIPSLPRASSTQITLPDTETSYTIPLWAMSDAMVVDGSFLRCRSVGLNWQMQRSLCESLKVKSLSVNFTVDNLFVLADKRFNGLNPELNNSVLPHNYSLGFNIGF